MGRNLKVAGRDRDKGRVREATNPLNSKVEDNAREATPQGRSLAEMPPLVENDKAPRQPPLLGVEVNALVAAGARHHRQAPNPAENAGAQRRRVVHAEELPIRQEVSGEVRGQLVELGGEGRARPAQEAADLPPAILPNGEGQSRSRSRNREDALGLTSSP